MKVFSIFARTLYSVKYEIADQKQLSMPERECNYKGHELERLTNKWTDLGYLRGFYDENVKYFGADFWKGISKEDFVLSIFRDIPHLLRQIKQMCIDGTIDKIFKPLDDRQYQTSHVSLLEVKSYQGNLKGRLILRVYAIRLEQGSYLITGGAIKVTEQMKDHPLTKLEVEKINYTKNYLCNNGVFDVDSFEDYKNC